MFEDGSLQPCPSINQIFDFGCGKHGVPYSSYNLTDVIVRAEQLVGEATRNLVVSTDDPEWLSEEIKQLKATRPNWNIFSLPPPKMHRSHDDDSQTNRKLQSQPKARSKRELWGIYDDYHYMRAEAGTESGVYFWAQIELASKCQGLIGHFGSGIAHLLMQFMCFENFGVCPPTFDWQMDASKMWDWGLNHTTPIGR